MKPLLLTLAAIPTIFLGLAAAMQQPPARTIAGEVMFHSMGSDLGIASLPVKLYPLEQVTICEAGLTNILHRKPTIKELYDALLDTKPTMSTQVMTHGSSFHFDAPPGKYVLLAHAGKIARVTKVGNYLWSSTPLNYYWMEKVSRSSTDRKATVVLMNDSNARSPKSYW